MRKVTTVLLGQSGVGKSTFLVTASKGHAPLAPVYSTIGVENVTFQYNGVRIQCWDASGNDKFKQITPMFVRNCDAVLYMFKPEQPGSLDHAIQWYNRACEQQACPDVHIFIANTNMPLSSIDKSNIPSDVVLAGSATHREDVQHILNTILDSTHFSPNREFTYSSHSPTQIQMRQCCGIQ